MVVEISTTCQTLGVTVAVGECDTTLSATKNLPLHKNKYLEVYLHLSFIWSG